METDDMTTIMTIGHSNQSLDDFLDKLTLFNITCIIDVRSFPYCRYTPHFTRDNLVKDLGKNDISYKFLGEELGGRPKNPNLYTNDIVDYEKMEKDSLFISGIDNIINNAKKYNISVMCSEQNPIDCHRCLLVGKVLYSKGFNITHILKDKTVASHEEIERKLLNLAKLAGEDLIDTRPQRLRLAYRLRSRKVAYHR